MEASLRPLRLDIGAVRPAEHLGPGWTAVDAYGDPDIKAMMWALPYADNVVAQIYSSHALEHIGKYQILPTLQEWRRVLQPAGLLTLQVPDLEWCCRHWLTHPTNGWDLDIIYGLQTDEGQFHKTGFSEAMLKWYVENVGFKMVDFSRMETHAQMTMQIVGMK